MKKNNVYDSSYIPYIHRIGRMTNGTALFLAFLPIIVLSMVYGIVPTKEMIVSGFVSIASTVGLFWIIEPISYFPVVGIAGTYMCCLSGNISNLKLPCAAAALKAANVEEGSREATIVSTLGIAVSTVVVTLFLTVAIFLGTAVLVALPAGVVLTLKTLLLPALFGAVLGQFAMKNIPLGISGLIIAIVARFVVGKMVSGPSVFPILLSVFGTIMVARLMFRGKEKLQ